jgi:FMN phosphatase YigB (HAD superfamily)
VAVDVPPTRAIFFDLGDTLVIPADRSWVPGAKAALAALGARGRLGVISNTGGLSRDGLSPLLPADFDWAVFAPELVILSGEVRVEKPDPAIFRLAVAAAGLPAVGCVFCTENLRDALVAQGEGMIGARLRPPPDSDIALLADVLSQAGIA